MKPHIWMVEWRDGKSQPWRLLYGQFYSRADARRYIKGAEIPRLYRPVRYVRDTKPCPLINYSKIATERPDLIAPWHQTDRALYFRTDQQASEWAAEFGGTARGRVIRVEDETGECDG